MSDDNRSCLLLKEKVSWVLYCLIRKKESNDEPVRFLVIEKSRGFTFPPTKMREGEDIYSALKRPLGGDIGLADNSYFPEKEFDMIPNSEHSPGYKGLTDRWYLFPVDVSLTEEGWQYLNSVNNKTAWWTLDEITGNTDEPNTLVIAKMLADPELKLLGDIHVKPSMDALALKWAAENQGVRILRNNQIKGILNAGNRAFNLRVADPYLAYQKQGLGFTWSFFTPKDKQDIHVHGMPAVEIYGVLEGKLQVWFKPMNQRGARTWRTEILEAGDWLEVEPLYCHFVCWSGTEGIGTVVKAAGSGELAGVGKIGVSGKTTCFDCNAKDICMRHPCLTALQEQCRKSFEERDIEYIEKLIENSK